jgi:hypothetical protein
VRVAAGVRKTSNKSDNLIKLMQFFEPTSEQIPKPLEKEGKPGERGLKHHVKQKVQRQSTLFEFHNFLVKLCFAPNRANVVVRHSVQVELEFFCVSNKAVHVACAGIFSVRAECWRPSSKIIQLRFSFLGRNPALIAQATGGH